MEGVKDVQGGTVRSSAPGSVSNDFGDVGGLVGSNFADRGTTRDSYWDTQTSGQSELAGGEGKTTSELQSPTGYTGIYENWNVDLDEDGVGDDLWDFGNASQYPTLRSSDRNPGHAAPGPVSDRSALVALYTTTDGPNWRDCGNCLSDAPIGQWPGATMDSSCRGSVLFLGNNLLIPSVTE